MTKPHHDILAIDIGSTIGWAFSRDGVISGWGIVNFRWKGSDVNARGHRFDEFDQWLSAWSGVDEVFYEKVVGLKSYDAMANHMGMQGIIEMFCSRIGAIPQNMFVSTLKAKFTGSGRADKHQMCEIAHKLGWRGGVPGTDVDHDAADACALIYCILRERGYEAIFEGREDVPAQREL